ncbi:MAG: D-3-phosphoglycerate dehydrogenase [Acidimicrobiales bacterium]|nr:MAG: D-3-phosphoglycerate dehydrogenase [Acidimicrobiales bacterium]
MSRILVTEAIADTGLEKLRSAGHEVDVRLGLSPDELLEAIAGADALIIRSATQVTTEVLDAADQLKVVGRAGIGLDNVDVPAATRAGVMVANAPQSNALSAAEHTMALLLSQARNVPQAHAALVAGRWERSKWEGVELADKVLGIVGLGRIGSLVAQRAASFGMQLIAHDPFVSADAARKLQVELVDLETLVGTADFLTLHLAKTPETAGLIGKDLLAKAKPELRIINVARGGIVDEAALAEAAREGCIGGAAVDVFDTEPTVESPLFEVENIVVTPHLGASTREAQDKAGVTIAEQVALALAGEFVPHAVNVDAAEVSELLRPFVPLAEHLGAIYGGLVEGIPERIDVELRGAIAKDDARIAVLAAVKGILSAHTDVPVSYVNALDLATERGLEVRTITAPAQDHVNVLRIAGGGHSIAGRLSGLDGSHRISELDDHALDIKPSDHMVIVRNLDERGMVGVVGATLGDAGMNISNMHIGESGDGVEALMVVCTDGAVPPTVQDALRNHEHVRFVRAITVT